jgi:putative PIN family toxin of toxin-antitoxin system
MIPNRLVLDTNVCLDLFVFEDPRWSQLLAALHLGQVQAVTSESCRREWRMVLDYACFKLAPDRRAQCMIQFDNLVTLLPKPNATEVKLELLKPLPRCSDPDDQKFLEVARDSLASMIITKDKALLKLAGKCKRLGYFSILKPDSWSLALNCLE